MNPIHPKVSNGAALAGLVSPLNIILTYYIDHWSGGLPVAITSAWVALITGIAYFAGSWFTGIPVAQLQGGNGNGAAAPPPPALVPPPPVALPAAPAAHAPAPAV